MADFLIATLDESPVSDAALEALLTESYVQGGFTDPEAATSLFAPPAVTARGTVLVAYEANGSLLGTATLVHGGSTASRLAATGEAELHLLCVRPASRGRGIGAALVDAIVALARRSGSTRVALWTQPTMRAARRLYEVAGFRRASALDFVRGSRTFLVYERMLSEEAGSAVPRTGSV